MVFIDTCFLGFIVLSGKQKNEGFTNVKLLKGGFRLPSNTTIQVYYMPICLSLGHKALGVIRYFVWLDFYFKYRRQN